MEVLLFFVCREIAKLAFLYCKTKLNYRNRKVQSQNVICFCALHATPVVNPGSSAERFNREQDL